jgi:aminoacrylate hydrolase
VGGTVGGIRFDSLGSDDVAAETVLLSSGLGGVAGYWQPQLGALTERYRVVTYDQRGTGRSRAPLPDRYSVAMMVDDVLAVLDAAGCGACHFVGHALGGLIGLDLALRAPARLASLTVINGWARLDSHTARCFAVRADLLRHVGVAAYVRAQPIFLHPAAWLSAHAAPLAEEEQRGIATFQGAETLLRRIDAISRFDIADRLASIATPTLVAATRDDILVPYTCSLALAAGLENATLDLAETGGHAGNVTNPAPFNAALLGFLAARTPRG